MFDVFIKIVSIVFRPLFDISRDAILKTSGPRRKMVKSLLGLYDDLEAVEYHSRRLLQDVEYYVTTNWQITPRNMRRRLVSTSEELRNASISLGNSLRSLYRMLDIQNVDLLDHLVGIHEMKKMFFMGRILAAPGVAANDKSNDSPLFITHPNDEIISIDYNNERLRHFYFHPEEIKKNFLTETELDLTNREQIIQLLDNARPRLAELGRVKDTLRDFIKENIQIQDYF